MKRQTTTKSHSDSNISVDKERARHVLRPLYQAGMGQRMLFAHITREVNAPQQRFFPEGVTKGGIEHRRWLFLAAMTDRRAVSELVYESHAQLWIKEPRLYSEEVLDMSFAEIVGLLQGENVGSPKESAKYWPRSAETLFNLFWGDPLMMYRKFEFVDDILLFKRKGGRPSRIRTEDTLSSCAVL